MQIPILLRRSARLQEDVRPIVDLEVVTGVCAEDAGLHIRPPPIRPNIQNFTTQSSDLSHSHQ